MLREPGAGPSARALARTRRWATGPKGREEGERGRGGVWSVFPLWRTNNPGQRGGTTVQPFNRVGVPGRKGGSGRGNPAPLIPSPLPPPRVLADAALRGALEHSARAAPAPPPPAHAEPARARAPCTPAPARCPGPARVWGAPPAPGGWGTRGENQHAEPGQVRGACTQGRESGGGGVPRRICAWEGGVHDLSGRREDVKRGDSQQRAARARGEAGEESLQLGATPEWQSLGSLPPPTPFSILPWARGPRDWGVWTPLPRPREPRLPPRRDRASSELGKLREARQAWGGGDEGSKALASDSQRPLSLTGFLPTQGSPLPPQWPLGWKSCVSSCLATRPLRCGT